jgi:hypothetical protein
MAQYSQCPSSSSSIGSTDTAGIAFTLTKRLIAVSKLKKVINLEAGLEMIALGIAICSQVCLYNMNLNISGYIFFARMAVFFQRRLWI